MLAAVKDAARRSAVGLRPIPDRGCARRLGDRQAGTKKRPLSAELRNIPDGTSPLLQQGFAPLNPLQTARRHYFHTVVAASVVKPGKNWVLPLRPEFVEPQQGYDKQDCESRAARRWLGLNGLRYSKLNPVYLGDDIYSKQPVCEEVLAVGGHFLFVCKPDSHKTMNEYLTGVEVPSLSRKVKRGKKSFSYTWRWMLGLPIRDGKDALEVNWLEIAIRDSNGKITYRNSFITDLPVDADNVEELAAAGRARWKIENETFNTLKTKGYNLEHNFGHGKNNLSAVLATLNLIAFAIHLAAELADKTWKAAIEVAGSRVRFFNNLRALTAYLLFPSWDSLLKTLAFQVAPPLPS